MCFGSILSKGATEARTWIMSYDGDYRWVLLGFWLFFREHRRCWLLECFSYTRIISENDTKSILSCHTHTRHHVDGHRVSILILDLEFCESSRYCWICKVLTLDTRVAYSIEILTDIEHTRDKVR